MDKNGGFPQGLEEDLYGLAIASIEPWFGRSGAWMASGWLGL
jgi:hypothetical protein